MCQNLFWFSTESLFELLNNLQVRFRSHLYCLIYWLLSLLTLIDILVLTPSIDVNQDYL